ncbi:MAG TPA: cobalamin-binding protein [Gemmatimonadales bacterium]|nr:cobalamin-binding protein [Gemmatimonadales bacterium]
MIVVANVVLLLAAVGVTRAAVVPDMLGRATRIPDRPLRLVSLAPSITETIFALGRGDWLVGVTTACDYPPEARRLPRVGGIAGPDLEQVVRLRPDVVFATAEGNTRALLDQLGRLGLVTFALQPVGYQGVIDSILAVGRVLAATDAAGRVADEIDRRVRVVRERVARRTRPRVLYLIWTDPLIAAGAGTYLDDLLGLAGGRNIVQERTSPYPRLNWEQVVARGPEVILLADHREDNDRAVTGQGEMPPEWRAWQAVPAIRTGRVLVVPSSAILRPGPRLGDGLARLARAIHPEAFGVREAP